MDVLEAHGEKDGDQIEITLVAYPGYYAFMSIFHRHLFWTDKQEPNFATKNNRFRQIESVQLKAFISGNKALISNLF